MSTYQLQHLTGRKLRVFLAVAGRIVPADEHDGGAGTPATAAMVDWALNRLDPDLRKLFLVFLVVTDFLGVFFGGRTLNSITPSSRRTHDPKLALSSPSSLMLHAPAGLTVTTTGSSRSDVAALRPLTGFGSFSGRAFLL